MGHDAGIGVSAERSSVCVVDGGVKIVVEAKAIGEPEALVALLRAPRFEPMRVGLEAGPLSQWQFATGGTAAWPPNSWRLGTCAPRSRRCR